MSTENKIVDQSAPAQEQSRNVPALAVQASAELIDNVLGGVGNQCLHNFPGDKMAQWKFIARCEGGDVADRETLGQEAFPLKYFYAHRVQIVNSESGEINEPVRTVLVDDNDNAVAFVSDGIGKSMARIIQTFGMGPYDPPIMVKINEVKTSKKRRLYTLVPA